MDASLIAGSMLFRGSTEAEVKEMLGCLKTRVCTYRRDAIIARTGEVLREVGIVLSGSVRIENNDVWGNNSILEVVEPGGTFGEAYACIPGQPMLVDAAANESCEILFIHVEDLLSGSCVGCQWHSRLMHNLLVTTARKNVNLSRRIFHTSSKTIRGRVLSYLSQQAAVQHSRLVTIPMDRQQLADYLSVDRSALSKELSKMKADGLLDYHKNTFKLIET